MANALAKLAYPGQLSHQSRNDAGSAKASLSGCDPVLVQQEPTGDGTSSENF